MDSRLLVVSIVTLIMSLSLITKTEATERTTAGSAALNLNGKMFTLSLYGGGITFYPSYYTPPWLSTTYAPRTTRPISTVPSWPSTTRYPTATPTSWPTTRYPTATPTSWPTTRNPTTTSTSWTATTAPTTTTKPWTTTTTFPTTTPSSPTRGVTVCLRYVTDYLQTQSPSIFTLSPSSTPLKLTAQYPSSYYLTFNGYYNLALTPKLKFLPVNEPDMWTSLCLTVDTRKNVAQVFTGSNMSIRKLLPTKFVWSGEPVIDFSGFDGQLTDVQMWDYPLLYKEVWSYMIKGFYGSFQGSVLTWSNIAYSLRGNTLMEDTYEWLAIEPIRRRGAGRNLKGKLVFKMMEESKKANWQLV